MKDHLNFVTLYKVKLIFKTRRFMQNMIFNLLFEMRNSYVFKELEYWNVMGLYYFFECVTEEH